MLEAVLKQYVGWHLPGVGGVRSGTMQLPPVSHYVSCQQQDGEKLFTFEGVGFRPARMDGAVIVLPKRSLITYRTLICIIF